MKGRIFVVFALATLVAGDETCLTGEEDPYLRFGTKTAYIFTGGMPNPGAHTIPGCQPAAFWLLNRHGSNNPEAEEIKDLQQLIDFKNNIVSNYKNGNFRSTDKRMCSADLNLLEKWEWNPRQNLSFAGDLTSDGYISTQQLAQAWKFRYPGLLTDNRHDYLFKYSNDERLVTTFRAFTEGIFRAQAEGLDIPKQNDDQTLDPYKSCAAWKRNVDDNDETLAQRHIFESKQEYKEMITNISLRLGFNYDIQKEMVQRMYLMCRYNKAWNVAQISPWCAAFTREDLQRLEYAEDLESYYRYGYGNPENQKMGCTYIKDMMNFLKNHVENPSPQQPRASLRLAGAEPLLLALGALGWRRDAAPLTGDNYHAPAVRARRWAASAMAPYNGNLAAVLYNCNPNGNFQVKDLYQVLFLENERTMALDGCRVGLCDWGYVKEKFGEVADKCDLQFCNASTKANAFFALSVLSLAFLKFV